MRAKHNSINSINITVLIVLIVLIIPQCPVSSRSILFWVLSGLLCRRWRMAERSLWQYWWRNTRAVHSWISQVVAALNILHRVSAENLVNIVQLCSDWVEAEQSQSRIDNWVWPQRPGHKACSMGLFKTWARVLILSTVTLVSKKKWAGMCVSSAPFQRCFCCHTGHREKWIWKGVSV